MNKSEINNLKSEKTDEATPLIYWDAIIDLAHIESKGHLDVLHKLINGELKSADFDLKNKQGKYPICGIKFNYSDRLLCTTIEINGKHYFLLLEVIYNHDYHKARFMKDGVLDDFIKRNIDALSDYIHKFERNASNRDSSSEKKNNKETGTKFKYKAVSFHQNKVIAYSNEQAEALSKQEQTLLITGGPGSGKSVLAQAQLEKEADKYNNTEGTETLIYITQSDELARIMERDWNAQPHSNPYNKKIIFRTYNSLIKELAGLQENDLVDRNNFDSWLSAYLKKIFNKNDPVVQEIFSLNGNSENKVLELLYQEFRIISGYSLKQYQPGNGTKSEVKSLFNEIKHRIWLEEAFSNYLHYLESIKKVHPAFSPIKMKQEPQFQFIVVDEAQDFSRKQLRNLKEWSIKNHICFFEDANQAIDDNKSNTHFIHELFNDVMFSHKFLSGSFRCPREVIRLANSITDLKLLLTGGLDNKYQLSQIQLNKEQEDQFQPQEDSVKWFDDFDSITNKVSFV
jgi:DNA replication protein DnaC